MLGWIWETVCCFLAFPCIIQAKVVFFFAALFVFEYSQVWWFLFFLPFLFLKSRAKSVCFLLHFIRHTLVSCLGFVIRRGLSFTSVWAEKSVGLVWFWGRKFGVFSIGFSWWACVSSLLFLWLSLCAIWVGEFLGMHRMRLGFDDMIHKMLLRFEKFCCLFGFC